jgi:dihydropteroate synthase
VDAAERDATVDRWIPRREAGRRTRLLGILNVTPDSFYDGGRYTEPSAAATRARAMIDGGADALDLGGESTRPGADAVSVEQEIRRVVPVLELLEDCEVPISIDTMKSAVARCALDAGATIVNDVSGLTHDPAMAEVCASARCGVILMHMRGTPATMRSLAHYDDVVTESIAAMESSLARAVRAGVREEDVILDPGIGFAKTPEHNLEILRRIPEYHALGRPLLLGVSRKSFLGRFGGDTSQERLPASIALALRAAQAGVEVLRVHDVAEHARALRAWDMIGEPTPKPEDSTC